MFENYIGQHKLKSHLKLYVNAAKKRNSSNPIEHLLLCGNPGLGKTTLAEEIANELKRPLIKLLGPHVTDLNFLEKMGPNTIVFIDEIHGLKPRLEEELYEPMDRAIWNNKPIRPFTLIGATTKEGWLSRPLRSRFPIVESLELYEPKDLQRIILDSAGKMSISINEEAAYVIASRSRGVPRLSKNYLRRVSYYGETISKSIAEEAMDHMGVDELSLTLVDRALLKTIRDRYSGGPVGLDTLAYALGEDKETVSLQEPWLIKKGLLERTKTGRILTKKGREHLTAYGE